MSMKSVENKAESVRQVFTIGYVVFKYIFFSNTVFTFWDIHPAQYTRVGGWRLWKLFTFIFSPTTPSTYHIYYLNNQFQHSLLLSLYLTQFFMRKLLRTELLENNNILSSLDRKKNELKRSKYGAGYVFLEFSSYFNSYAVRVISSTLLSVCVCVCVFSSFLLHWSLCAIFSLLLSHYVNVPSHWFHYHTLPYVCYDVDNNSFNYCFYRNYSLTRLLSFT